MGSSSSPPPLKIDGGGTSPHKLIHNDKFTNMKFELSAFLKAPAQQEQIDTISFADLLKQTGATGFKPSESARYGSRVHLMKGEERLFAIRVGKSVKLANDVTTLDGLKELITNHVIYYGKSNNGTWVAFGKKGELSAGVTYSLEQLAAAGMAIA